MRRTVLIGLVALALALGFWLGWGADEDDPSDLDPSDGVGRDTDAPTLTGRATPTPLEVPRTAALGGRERICGFVRTAAGDPVPGIPVELRGLRVRPWVAETTIANLNEAFGHAGWAGDTEPLGRTVSATDGSFTFAGARWDRDYVVRALPSPPWFLAESWAGANPGTYADPIVVVIGRGAPLRLRVLDASGRGLRALVSGFIWRARTKEGPDRPIHWRLPLARTGAEGRLLVQAVPRGRLVLRVIVPELGAHEGYEIHTPRDGEVVLHLGDPEGATVHGVVRDDRGAPIAGARVLVVSEEHGPRAARVSLGDVSGTDGRYRVFGLPPGKLDRVSVVAPGFVFVENAAPPLGLRAREAVRVDVELKRGGVIEGTVEGPDGAGLARAWVQAQPAEVEGIDWQPEIRTTAGPGGRFRLEGVPAGRGRLWAYARGHYLKARVEGLPYEIRRAGETLHLSPRLERGIPLRGLVVDEGGAPVPRVCVRVHVEPEGFGNEDSERERLTDEHGRFVHEGLPPGDAHRIVARSRSGFARLQPVRVAAGDRVKHVRLVHRRGAVIAGRVELEGPPGVVRPRVRCRPDAGSRQTLTVDAGGRFTFEGVPGGQVRLFVVDAQSTRCGEEVRLDVAWGQRVEGVVLRSLPLGDIEGHVVDEAGRPVGGVLVRVRGVGEAGKRYQATEHTDADGRFFVAAMADVEYVLYIGGQRHPEPVRVGRRGLRFVHRPKPRTLVTVEGSVVDPDGRPVTGALLQVWRRVDGSTRSDVLEVRRGRFHEVYRDGGDSIALEVTHPRDADGQPLNLMPRKLTDVDVGGGPIRIQLETGQVIEGRVEGPPADAFSRLELRLARVTKDGGTRRLAGHLPAVVQPDGRFEFVALGPHEFALGARGLDDWIQIGGALRVRAGQRDVVVRLHPAASITGRVTDARGEPALRADVHFYWDGSDGRRVTKRTATIQDGRFALHGIPAGVRGTLRVLHREVANKPLLGWARMPVAVGAKDLALHLAPGVSITGVVVDAEGTPRPRPYLRLWALDQPTEGLHTHAYGDPDGSFAMGPMPPGRYRIQGLDRRGHPAGEALEIEAPAANVRILFTPR